MFALLPLSCEDVRARRHMVVLSFLKRVVESFVPDPGTITRAVNAITAGDGLAASEAAVARILDQLRSLAAARLRMDPRAALQPTELVHEAFVKLFGAGQKPWENRAHFFGSAAIAIQRLLVDEARRRRKTPQLLPSLDGVPARMRALDPITVSNAVDALHGHDRELAAVVRLRVFAGMTASQTAEALDLSPRTLTRRWGLACAWIFRHLGEFEPL